MTSIEEPIDEDQDMEKLRKKLLRKYSSVFKRDLGKEDRININPVKIELIDEPSSLCTVLASASVLGPLCTR